jgi:hypothetical protein
MPQDKGLGAGLACWMEGDGAISQSQRSDSVGLHLLFAAGKRPTLAAIRNFAAAQPAIFISHDPADAPEHHTGEGEGRALCVELLLDGLTFDLAALAPGEASDFGDIESRFDWEQPLPSGRFEAAVLQPGHHLRGAASMMPVARTMIRLACELAQHFDDLEAIVWPPSQSVIGRRFFMSVVSAWLDGGAFPALGLVAFREAMDGALQSVGLEFWIGQELRIEPPLSDDRVAATRLGVRLVNQLVLLGGVDDSERIVAPDGSRLIMRLSRNRKFIRVFRE